MKIIGLVTGEFRIFYGLVRELKKRGLPFVSLSMDEPVPFNVGAVITTGREAPGVDFPCKVVCDEGPANAVDLALQILRGRGKTKYLVIGIDPGMAPGIAVMADGELINRYKCYSPEEVFSVVEGIFNTYEGEKKYVKIGHQAVTHRNRIVNHLLGLKSEVDFVLEIVDESNTTLSKHDPDINAAVEISFMSGSPVDAEIEIRPSDGEIRWIQKMSRIKSDSRITISGELAKKVATGKLKLREAIELQRKGIGAGD